MNIRAGTRVLEIRDQRFIVCVDLLDILRLSHQSPDLSLSYTRSSEYFHVFTSTVIALLKLSETWTF